MGDFQFWCLGGPSSSGWHSEGIHGTFPKTILDPSLWSTTVEVWSSDLKTLETHWLAPLGHGSQMPNPQSPWSRCAWPSLRATDHSYLGATKDDHSFGRGSNEVITRIVVECDLWDWEDHPKIRGMSFHISWLIFWRLSEETREVCRVGWISWEWHGMTMKAEITWHLWFSKYMDSFLGFHSTKQQLNLAEVCWSQARHRAVRL